MITSFVLGALWQKKHFRLMKTRKAHFSLDIQSFDGDALFNFSLDIQSFDGDALFNFKPKGTMPSYAFSMENCICIYYV